MAFSQIKHTGLVFGNEVTECWRDPAKGPWEFPSRSGMTEGFTNGVARRRIRAAASSPCLSFRKYYVIMSVCIDAKVPQPGRNLLEVLRAPVILRNLGSSAHRRLITQCTGPSSPTHPLRWLLVSAATSSLVDLGVSSLYLTSLQQLVSLNKSLSFV